MTDKYILDASVIISDPSILSNLKEDHEKLVVVLPDIVLAEIDNLKKSKNRSTAKAASSFLKNYLSELESPSSLSFVVRVARTAPYNTTSQTNDEKIVKVALDETYTKDVDGKVLLLTNDYGQSVLAKQCGVKYQRRTLPPVDPTECFKPMVKNIGYEDKYSESRGGYIEVNAGALPNQFVQLEFETGENVLVRRDGGNNRYKYVHSNPVVYRAIRAKGPEQSMAADVLLDPNVELVNLLGAAGVGKTLLAIAAGLKLVESGEYDKVVYCRPTVSLGREIGYTPGGIEEKMEPWVQGLMDNLEVIYRNPSKPHETNALISELVSSGTVQCEPLSFIRGRSLQRQYLVTDESQNCTALELKTILTRAADGTKVVLCGDISQSDTRHRSEVPFLTLAKRFFGNPLASTVLFSKVERSGLAAAAVRLL